MRDRPWPGRQPSERPPSISIAARIARSARPPQDIRDINLLTDYRDQLYGAVCLSVVNSLEKFLR